MKKVFGIILGLSIILLSSFEKSDTTTKVTEIKTQNEFNELIIDVSDQDNYKLKASKPCFLFYYEVFNDGSVPKNWGPKTINTINILADEFAGRVDFYLTKVPSLYKILTPPFRPAVYYFDAKGPYNFDVSFEQITPDLSEMRKILEDLKASVDK